MSQQVVTIAAAALLGALFLTRAGSFQGRVPNETAGLWLERAGLASTANDRDSTLAALSHAEGLNPTREEALRITAMYRGLKEYRRAVPPMEPLLAASPRDTGLWLERAELSLKADDLDSASESLARVEDLTPAKAQARRAAALRRGLKERRRAMEREEASAKVAARAAQEEPSTGASPRDVGYWISRAEASAKAGDIGSALESLARAEGAAPEEPDRRRIVAMYRELKQYRRAMVAVQALISTAPRVASFRIERAELALLEGDRGAAREALAQAEALSPAAADMRRMAALWIEEAASTLKGGDRGEAFEFLARAERMKPAARELRRIAALYGDLREYRRTLAPLKGLIASSPRDSGLRIEYAESALLAGERGASVFEALSRAEELRPPAEKRLRIAAMYRQLKEPRRALAALEPLVVSAPENAALWLERAELSLLAGDRAAALESLVRADGLKPTAAPDLRRIAAAYVELNEYSRALVPMGALVKSSPGDIGLRLALAELLSKTGQRSAVLESLARAEGLTPKAEERQRIALLYQEAGDGVRALAIFQKLVQDHPAVAAYFSDLGICEYRQGLIESSIKNLQTAIGLDARHIPAYLTLGAIFTEQGRYDDALTFYDAAISAPSSPEYEFLRKMIVVSREELRSRKARP